MKLTKELVMIREFGTIWNEEQREKFEKPKVSAQELLELLD